jgi:hypothetical protein
MSVVNIIVCVLRASLLGRAALAAENLALRQQLTVLQRSVKRPRLQKRDLIRILTAHFEYYHESRTHLSPARNAPEQRRVEPPELGKVVAIPQVAGLHHRYTRAA